MAKWRRVLAALLVVGASLFFWRRRSARRVEKVDLYYEDGSMISLVDGTEGAERLLPLARRVLSAARA
jgi:hypothetical protein